MPDIDTPEEAEPYPEPYPFDDEWDEDDDDWYDLREDWCDHEWIDRGTYLWCPWCGAKDWI